MRQPDYVSREQCERLLTPQRALELAETALRWEAAGSVYYPPERQLRMAPPDSDFRYHSKAVMLRDIGVAGCRVVGYTVAADGSRPGADDATRLVILMEETTGVPLAIVDEHWNYALRTAASVGVAARLLAPGPVRLGIIGAGTVARAALRVMLAGLDVQEVLLTSRTLGKCDELARIARAGSVEAVSILEGTAPVLEGCDVVITATTAREPLLTEPLRPGVVLCALGSNELSAEVYLSADRFIVDDWAQTQRASDIAQMIASGAPLEKHLSASLSALVADGAGLRGEAAQSVVVRTEGLASQDLLFAHAAWQESRSSA
jgi:ornithine cyclodeaminase/alanine dehydrogenase-like protein (mu-crystallin family)